MQQQPVARGQEAHQPPQPPKRNENGPKDEKKKENRSQFESRMRRELQDLFNARMAELMKNQIEATKMTVEAANQLANIHQQKSQHETSPSLRSTKKSKTSLKSSTATQVGRSSQGIGVGSIPEDIKTMISQTESNIPEILSAVEATDRSAKDIQRSIKSAIQELTHDDDETSNNITEEIAAELTEDDISTSHRKTSTILTYSSDESTVTKSHNVTATSVSGGENFFRRHLEDQRRRDKQQSSVIKKRQKLLAEKTKVALEKIEAQKEVAQKEANDDKLEDLIAKERKVRKHYHERKEELTSLRYALQIAERERNLLWHQHQKLASLKIMKKNLMSNSSTEDDTLSSSTAISLPIEEDETSEAAASKHKANKRPPKSGIKSNNVAPAPIKTPLSPKRTYLRKRHSSADSEESLGMASASQVETMSSAGDQSDLEIRVQTLQDELGRRMKTAAKLKKEQKSARRERLKAQEDALKKQIEVYDQLIETTKADIDSAPSSPQPSSSSSHKIVQPQIKTPKRQSLKTDSSLSETSNPSQINSSLEEEASSTDTIIASPNKVPTTPCDEPEQPAVEANVNYSDDFTFSSCSPAPPIQAVATSSLASTSAASTKIPKEKLSEKTIDSICGHLLEAMIDDAVGRMKKNSQQTASPPQMASGPTRPLQSVEASPIKQTPSTGAQQVLSPRSRSSLDHMQTTFDISSESSEEGKVVVFYFYILCKGIRLF